MCLLDRLNMGGTLLKYERTVATALLCHTAWHSAMPGQAFAEDFCESLLFSLVTKKGQNRVAVTIDDVDNLYHLITIRKEGHRMNVCKIPDSFVNSVRQRLTAYLNVERVYVPWVRWCAEPSCAIQAHWPRRGVPSFPPSLLIPKGSNHYKQVLVSVLIVLTQQGPLKAGFKRSLSKLIPLGLAQHFLRARVPGDWAWRIGLYARASRGIGLGAAVCTASLAARASPPGALRGGRGTVGGCWGWRSGSGVSGYRYAGQWGVRATCVCALAAPALLPTGGGASPPLRHRWGGGGGRSRSGGRSLPGWCPASLVLPHPLVPAAWLHRRRARPSPAPPLVLGLGLRRRRVPPAVAPVAEGGAQGPGEPVLGLRVRDAEHRPPLQDSRPRRLRVGPPRPNHGPEDPLVVLLGRPPSVGTSRFPTSLRRSTVSKGLCPHPPGGPRGGQAATHTPPPPGGGPRPPGGPG